MAQFVQFAPNVEVNGVTVLTTVNSFPDFMKNVAVQILNEKGIVDPKPDGWYSQKAWLDSFKEINDKFGANTLFKIGKEIPKNAKFPPEIDNIEKAMMAIDVAYKMNHRNGDIGFYKMAKHDVSAKKIYMQCKNPYPCDFDRGIIMSMARLFKTTAEVINDETKPCRKNGDDECWYIVSYN